jgi:endonuclease/exonuclease/phosphatase family metal-dependent hydrolase
MSGLAFLLIINLGQLAASLKVEKLNETQTKPHHEIKPKLPTLRGLAQDVGHPEVSAHMANSMWTQLAHSFSHAGKAESDPSTLRLLNMNLWFGGNMVMGGPQMLTNVINEVNPNVVILQEAPQFLDPLVASLQFLGKNYHAKSAGEDIALLSKWPIEKAEVIPGTDNAMAAFHLQHPSAGKMVIGSVHLDHTHYAPVMPRGYDPKQEQLASYGEMTPVNDGASLLQEDALSARATQMQAGLEYLKALEATTPVVLAGDFNQPSHLDWTNATAQEFEHNGAVVEWPHSKMMQGAGFTDAWRSLYPDPLEKPGFSWPSHAFGEGYTGWAPKADERERIDYVYHNSGLVAKDAGLLGNPFYYVKGSVSKSTDHFPFEHLPLPSDHKGLYVELSLPEPGSKAQPAAQLNPATLQVQTARTYVPRHLR